jgi:hypothetical protein
MELIMINRDFIIGGVAQDDDYFFHKEYVNEIWDLLKKDNIILLSPRRTGKTSLMYRMIEEPKYGYKVIHFNVEALTNSADFFIDLIDALYELEPEYLKKISKGWDTLTKPLSKIEELGAMSFKVKLKQSENWKQNWEELSLVLINKIISLDDKVLFIIDEFPDMLNTMLQNNKKETITFLHHFRKIRLDKKTNNIKWLVSGSVNIRGVLDEEKLMNTINDFTTEYLPIIQENEVNNFISSMLEQRGVIFNESILKTIYDLLGEPIPFFIQLFTQEIYRYWRREKNNINEIGTKEVKEIFNKHLLGESAKDKLQHYHSRIKMHYPDKLHQITYDILDSISKSESGISERQLYTQYQLKQDTPDNSETKIVFKSLMLRLDSDFYTYKNDNNIYDFKVHLIKIWWRKNWGQL